MKYKEIQNLQKAIERCRKLKEAKQRNSHTAKDYEEYLLENYG